MNKKAIKKIIAFVKMLKAPSKMMPYIISLVIGIVRTVTDGDAAKLVDLKEQGFVCRRSDRLPAGCGSPSAAVCADGKLAVAFSCGRVENDAMVSSICLLKSADPMQINAASRRYVLTTPLHVGNVTLTQVPQGLLLGWQTKSNAYLHYPSGLANPVLQYLKANNSDAVAKLSGKEKDGGWHYALIPENGDEKMLEIEAPAFFSKGATVLSGGEILWLCTKNGKALAYMTKDACTGFDLVGEVPTIETGRTYSHACAVKLKNGRLLAALCSSGELYTSYSDDMGVRWTCPKPLEIKGTSPDISIREDGVVALSFVDPSKKFAIRCVINKDGESEWCKVRQLVSTTGENSRRPYTVGLKDKFYTVSRIRFCGEKESSILYTVWTQLKEDYDPIAEAQQQKEEKKNRRKKKKADVTE